MSPELEQALNAASVPFYEGGGAITPEETRMKSWRYFLEVNSVCNLHCPTCTKGNQEGYDHLTGVMDPDLMEKIIEKIANENNRAIVFVYGNSEPFLHPKLGDCIRAIKRRGLNAQLSTNLNFIRNQEQIDDILGAKPDMIIISLSGFTQPIYVRGHAGGNIEKVKTNMRRVAEANNQIPLDQRIKISVNYHIYNDNEHEIPLMQEYATNLGIGFFTSYARAISMENAIQYCRDHDPEATPFEVQPGRPDWNTAFPPSGQTYKDAMSRLLIPPTEARKMYEGMPFHPVCPIGQMFTFIRHDGKTQLCACTADRRIILKDFLGASQDELAESRVGHAICQQCLKYRMSYYFHIVDRKKWGDPNP